MPNCLPNCLSVFDHCVVLVFKGLKYLEKISQQIIKFKNDHQNKWGNNVEQLTKSKAVEKEETRIFFTNNDSLVFTDRETMWREPFWIENNTRFVNKILVQNFKFYSNLQLNSTLLKTWPLFYRKIVN